MSDTPEKSSSFPNSDQVIPGVTDSSRPEPVRAPTPTRPTVNIFEALESEKRKDDDLQKIHTFQEDIASTIKNDNLSMIKMALAEKKRQERQGEPLQFEENNTKKYVIYGGIGLVALMFIIGVVFFVSNSLNGGDAPENQAVVLRPLLYTEERAAISTNNRDSDDIRRLIKREGDTPPGLGSIRAILLMTGEGTSTREITSGEFLRGLRTHASDILIRSLDAQFLLGLYAFSPNDFFMLLKVNSYDNAFAAMLEWEPDMENDLGSILITRRTIVPITVLTQASSTITMSTSSVPAQEGGRVWVDRVVNNKDARVLIDAAGNPAMLYTFLDKETLVLSSSDKALKEVMFRLTAGRIAR